MASPVDPVPVDPIGVPRPPCPVCGEEPLEKVGGALQCMECGHRYSVDALLLEEGWHLLSECLTWVPPSLTLPDRAKDYQKRVNAYLGNHEPCVVQEEEEG